MDIFLRWPGGKPKALTFSYDDGVESDIRLADFMDKYNVKGTFNINTQLFEPEGTVHEPDAFFRRMSKKQIVDRFKNSNHELAVHTLTHTFLGQLPIACAANELLEDAKNIEQITEKPVRGMAYPYGDFSDEVIKLLKDTGFLYARMADNDTLDFALPKEPLSYMPTCHHANPELMNVAKRFVEDDVEKEHPFFPEAYLFYVWGHTFEFERDHNWNIIEDLIKYVSNKDDVYYATNSEIFGYMKKWHHMEYTIDGRFAYNPTDTDLFLLYNGRSEVVKSGKTKKLSLV